jgi:hypothetical protein
MAWDTLKNIIDRNKETRPAPVTDCPACGYPMQINKKCEMACVMCGLVLI